MGFQTRDGSEIALRQPSSKTFVNAVDDILISTGVSTVGSLGAPNRHTLAAMGAVNNALDRIWNAAFWDWRFHWVNFTMDSNVMWYALPDDFQAYTAGPVGFASPYGLTQTTYEELIAEHPKLYNIPSPDLLGDENYSSLSVDITKLMSDNDFYGVVTKWGIRGGHLFLFKVPDDDYYTDWDTDKRLVFGYYAALKRLTDGDDTIPTPPELYPALIFLGLGYYKQVFEYADFQFDEQRGEQILRLAVARNRRLWGGDKYSGFDFSNEV